MLGAIVGDIVGSRFEYNNIKSKDFELMTEDCFVTDDTVLTLAVCDALLNLENDLETATAQSLRIFSRRYADNDYGDGFRRWMLSDEAQAYGSFGNGAAMRVSACSIAAQTLEEAKHMSDAVTAPTHNHPEGMKGAQATAVAGFLAKTGLEKTDIEKYINQNYYPMGFTLDEIRPTYRYEGSCQGTVPFALKAFFESDSFEDAIRNAVSIGGDSDTLAAITGGVAGIYYGVDRQIAEKALSYLDDFQKDVMVRFEKAFNHQNNLCTFQV